MGPANGKLTRALPVPGEKAGQHPGTGRIRPRLLGRKEWMAADKQLIPGAENTLNTLGQAGQGPAYRADEGEGARPRPIPGAQGRLSTNAQAGQGAAYWAEAKDGLAARPIPGAENTLNTLGQAGQGTAHWADA